MKNFLTVVILVVLSWSISSCKKDQAITSDLSVQGYGPMMFASGDAISIYGSGFDSNPDNNTVSFNGVAGEVATASPNRLQVIVPFLAASGKITVSVHGQTVTPNITYTLVNVLTGAQANNTILSNDKKYLLRGNVTFNGKLIIQAGTVIFCEKATNASLYATDIDLEGTPSQPIVFTSDQPVGNRRPGDWSGANLSNGIMKNVRIEFAGSGGGAALTLALDSKSTYQNIQVSYSAGDGFLLYAGKLASTLDSYASYLVAFACQGADFHLNGGNMNLQYGLGLKDPYYANISSGIGILDDQTLKTRLSNFTLVGYNPAARNILNTPAGLPLTLNAGAGVQIGCYSENNNQYYEQSEEFALYNSVIAASWLSGISMFGQGANSTYGAPWNDYENNGVGGYLVTLRNNYLTGTAPALLPFRGGVFGKENLTQANDGFESTLNDPKLNTFALYNDTTRVLNFSLAKDDLGIAGLTDYKNLNKPVLVPLANSILLSSAKFPSGTPVDNPLFNKDIKFVGAFGSTDWTAPWCNFNPQITNY